MFRALSLPPALPPCHASADDSILLRVSAGSANTTVATEAIKEVAATSVVVAPEHALGGCANRACSAEACKEASARVGVAPRVAIRACIDRYADVASAAVIELARPATDSGAEQ